MILFKNHYGCSCECKARMYYDKVNEPDNICQANAALSSQVGIYVFQLMDHYTAIVSIMFLAFFEVVGVCWLYGERDLIDRHCATFELFRRQALNRIAKCLILTGVKNLSSNLLEMTGKRPNIFFRVCWWVICPVLITVSVIVTAFLKPQPGLVLELKCVSVSLRLSWCSR